MWKVFFFRKTYQEGFKFKNQLKNVSQPPPILPFPQTQIPLCCYSYTFLSEIRAKELWKAGEMAVTKLQMKAIGLLNRIQNGIQN